MKSFCRGAFVTLIWIVLAIPLGASADDIGVEISVDNGWLDASEDVVVYITLTNHGKKPARVLKWYTAADGIEDDLFIVSRDGETLRYLGAHYKRPAPVAGNYLHLKGGESVTHVAELSSVYDFSQTGDYSVQFNVESLSLFDPAAEHRNNQGLAKVESLQSNELFVWVQGRETDWSQLDESEQKRGDKGGGKPGGGGEPPPPSGRISFTGRCSNGQQTEILDAIEAAVGISNDANGYLLSGNTGARYTTWFGEVTQSRYNTVKGNFGAISTAMANEDITVDCKCKQNYYAYVYPNQPYKIYVCRAFWSAPLTGTDSKAGTLVHEMSHFDVVAGTDDVVYGQSGAKALAISDPNRAIRNADSHEYFAENTPAQN
jgi:peptidyl-Lys metalloendopeptidase